MDPLATISLFGIAFIIGAGVAIILNRIDK